MILGVVARGLEPHDPSSLSWEEPVRDPLQGGVEEREVVLVQLDAGSLVFLYQLD